MIPTVLIKCRLTDNKRMRRRRRKQIRQGLNSSFPINQINLIIETINPDINLPSLCSPSHPTHLITKTCPSDDRMHKSHTIARGVFIITQQLLEGGA